jgi:hypothetical protein
VGDVDRLSSDEVALVLRRAADLEAQAEGRTVDDGFDPAAVEEAALEVGLSPTAVRQALAELHTGALTTDRTRHLAVGGPSTVTAARLVPTRIDVVHATAERFLRKQTFELRRRHDEVAIYRLRRDMVANLRRKLDFTGAIQLDGVRSVTLTVSPAGSASASASAAERCMVRLEAELGPARGRVAVASTGMGVGAAGFTGLVGLVLGEGAVVAAALPIGAGFTAAGMGLGHRWLGRRRQEVAEVLDALLDVLEQPTRPGLPGRLQTQTRPAPPAAR